MIGIYKITNPKGKVYIGQSINIQRRFRTYNKIQSCKSQPKLYNSLFKYGVENHVFEVILECEESQLNELERYYQDLHNSVINGLNCTLTSCNTRSGKFSIETRNKISIKLSNRTLSEETKAKISKAKKGVSVGKGRKMSDEQKLKISIINKGNKYCLGRHLSEETRRKIARFGTDNKNFGSKRTNETKLKMSMSLKGKNTWRKGMKNSEETILKMIDSSSTAIPIINILTNEKYKSLKEYCRIHKLNYHSVKSHINGYTKINKYSYLKKVC